MGRRRCCCSCELWNDGFDRDPGDTAPDGINYLVPRNFSYTGNVADWSIVTGKLIAGVADSQIKFHDGAAKTFHVLAGVHLPNIGDYVKLHYGGNEAVVERLSTTSTRYTIAGRTYVTGEGPVDNSFSVMFYRRSPHAYYFDAFPGTAPDADLVYIGQAEFTGVEAAPCISELDLPALQFYKQDLGAGFTEWGFSASAGAGLNYLGLVNPIKKCGSLIVSCCSPCWNNPSTTALTVGGFSDRDGTCLLSYFNKTFILDGDNLTASPCGWVTLTEPPSPQDPIASREIISTLTNDDPLVDAWYINVFMPWISIGPGGIAGKDAMSWSSAILTREQLCAGGSIPLVPGLNGIPSGYDIYADEIRPDGWVGCDYTDGTPPPHTAITMSYQL